MPLDAGARVGVLGAGAMGTGIAQVAATHGHAVVVADADASALERARSGLAATMRREVEKGRLDRGRADEILARIAFESASVTGPLNPFTDCAIVIEAIVERLDI
jgi:3-hydroxybutyryl-CoA dehydrogenase